jgi:ribosomal protein L40E
MRIYRKKIEKEKKEMGICPDCGTKFPMDTMYCVKCQKKVKLDDKKKEGLKEIEDLGYSEDAKEYINNIYSKKPFYNVYSSNFGSIKAKLLKPVLESKSQKYKFLKEEKVDVKKIIKDLQGDFSGSNEDQGKGLALLKGLAFSDEDIANDFMKELDKATTKISKDILAKYEKQEKFISKHIKRNLYK